MNSHDSHETRLPCAAASPPVCPGQHAGQHRRLAWAQDRGRCAGRRQPSRCPGSLRRRGVLADLGSCWFRRFPWSPLAWRSGGPHS